MAYPQRKPAETGIESVPPPSRPEAPLSGGRIAHVKIFHELSAVEAVWRGLERDDAVKTPYQSFDLLSLWQSHIGAPAGVSPRVVVGYDEAERPAFLWPLGRAALGPLNILSFLGGKHANFNYALWRRDILETVSAENVRAVIGEIAAGRHADLLALHRQPRSWEEFANPLALLPHQPSPSESLHLTITARGEEQISQILSSTMRGQLRSKERRLQKLPGYHYLRATTPAEVDRLLNAFFPLKAAHMQAQSLPNSFADPRHEAFLRHACQRRLPSGAPLVDIHAIEGGGDMIAIFGAINDGRRSSGMFNTYTLSTNARQSPGLILLVHVITDLAERGVRSFDLGVGEAKYKTIFCKEAEPLFDSFLALTPLGRLAALAASAGGRIKRQIKQNERLSGLLQKLRQRIG
jgi:CelD/BcsL family acetyltransferase involved in cellulose biosynthesis